MRNWGEVQVWSVQRRFWGVGGLGAGFLRKFGRERGKEEKRKEGGDRGLGPVEKKKVEKEKKRKKEKKKKKKKKKKERKKGKGA